MLNLNDSTSEMAITTNVDVLRVGPVKPVIGGGADTGDVLVGEDEDPLVHQETWQVNYFPIFHSYFAYKHK